MRTTLLDFSPLFRSSIGFDRLMETMETVNRASSVDNWPPYDIVKSGESEYRITMAIAGFSEEDVKITQEQNMLLINGQKAEGENKAQYLHHGIADRAFERRFELADHVHVVGAHLVHGMLTIDLKFELPEEKRPRRIPISHDKALRSVEPKQIEATAA